MVLRKMEESNLQVVDLSRFSKPIAQPCVHLPWRPLIPHTVLWFQSALITGNLELGSEVLRGARGGGSDPHFKRWLPRS